MQTIVPYTFRFSTTTTHLLLFEMGQLAPANWSASCPRPVVFNLFHTVALFSSQGN